MARSRHRAPLNERTWNFALDAKKGGYRVTGVAQCGTAVLAHAALAAGVTAPASGDGDGDGDRQSHRRAPGHPPLSAGSAFHAGGKSSLQKHPSQ